MITKHRLSINFGGITFTVLELCPFTNGKNAEFFISVLYYFSLSLPNIMKLIHNAYYHKIQIKFGGVT